MHFIDNICEIITLDIYLYHHTTTKIHKYRIMTTISQQIDTETPIINKDNLIITWSIDESDCMIATVNGLEVAYAREQTKGIDVGSDDYHLTNEEINTITLSVGYFLENEPQEETVNDYTFDVAAEQGIYGNGY